MKREVMIKGVARERAMTLLGIAKKLGIYRSNMSAIASGSRGVSLDVLKKICYILDCGLDEIVFPAREPVVFKNKMIQAKLDSLERVNYDGIDKTWVNKVILASWGHFKQAKKVSK